MVAEENISVVCYCQTTDRDVSRLRHNYTLRLMSVSGGAQLAAANDSEATIVVVASGYPHGLFEFTGLPTVTVTRQQNQVNNHCFLSTPRVLFWLSYY